MYGKNNSHSSLPIPVIITEIFKKVNKSKKKSKNELPTMLVTLIIQKLIFCHFKNILD